MNLTGLLIGFVGVILVAGMIVFIGSTQSLAITDSNGDVGTATMNSTDALVTNVTAVAGASTGYLALAIAGMVIIAGIAILLVYSKK